MIASRLAQALKRQDWVTIAIELVLVTVGVLIALQLGQWSQSRADQQGLRQILERLDEETVTNLEIIENYLDRYARSLDAIGPAREVIETCDGSDAAMNQVVAAIASMSADFNPSFVALTAEELSRQDRYLDRLSAEFRAAFNRFQAQLAEDDTSTTQNFILLWNNHVLNHPAISARLDEDLLSTPLQLTEPMDVLCQDNEFRRRFFISAAFVAGLEARLASLQTEAARFRASLDEERQAQR